LFPPSKAAVNAITVDEELELFEDELTEELELDTVALLLDTEDELTEELELDTELLLLDELTDELDELTGVTLLLDELSLLLEDDSDEFEEEPAT
jgi:hypothetical protein